MSQSTGGRGEGGSVYDGDDELSRRPILHHDQDDNELDLQSTGCGSSACCNPSSTLHRFIALVFMCLLGFGSYFCYDNPGALQDNFKKDLDLSTTEFVMLYSIYSWPNVILCFIGGFLIDRVFGIRMGTIIYLFILMIGQLIFAIGGLMDTFSMMIIGRFIFGIGAESLAVAQNNYAVLWFKGKELNMVFGLQLSFARVGSTVNFLVMEPLYKYMNQFYKGAMCTGAVLLLATSTCVMSFICALILGWMDKRAQRILQRNDNPGGEVAKLTDVKTFKITFWMVSVICVAYYVAIFPFIALGKVFFMRKFDFSPEDANAVNSIVYIISAVASPIFGYVIDKFGRNISWVFLSILATIGAHSILAFTFLNPYYGMTLMGLSYSMLASSLWPIVALIIPEYQLGTAYGICQAVQNLGLAVISMLSGMIVDDGGFFMLEIFFIGWLSIALIATVIIYLYDSNNNGNLNMTPEQREQRSSTINANNYENISDNDKTNNNQNKITKYSNYSSTATTNAKMMGSSSVDEISPDDEQTGDGGNADGGSPGTGAGYSSATPAMRNRYLKRVGVDPENGSDCEPLLDS